MKIFTHILIDLCFHRRASSIFHFVRSKRIFSCSVQLGGQKKRRIDETRFRARQMKHTHTLHIRYVYFSYFCASFFFYQNIVCACVINLKQNWKSSFQIYTLPNVKWFKFVDDFPTRSSVDDFSYGCATSDVCFSVCITFSFSQFGVHKREFNANRLVTIQSKWKSFAFVWTSSTW